jgi:virginiamycin B lyase
LRRTLALLGGAVAAALFAGCGPTTPISSGTPTPAPPFVPRVSAEYNVPTANGGPAGMIKAGTSMLFTEETSNKIGELNSTATFSEFNIPTAGAKPLQITAGADGNYWFTESAVGKIGRITTSGIVSEFVLPSGLSGEAGSPAPMGITAGNNGALWITDPGANGIWELTTGGCPTFYPLATANAGPGSIAQGPDGNVWFVETNANKIGVVPATVPTPPANSCPNSTGPTVTTEYPVTTPNAGLGVIVPGSDNALWFTETTAKQIGRMTTAGTVTSEKALPGMTTPFGLVLGVDGNFYIGDAATNQIGQYVPSTAKLRLFSIPTKASGVYWLTLGPDNYVYFTEQSGNKIAQFRYF